MGITSEQLERLLAESGSGGGGSTPTVIGENTTVTVGTASTQLVPANTERVSLLIRNTGDVTIHLGFGGAATADGFAMDGGNYLVVNATQEIAAITESGESTVSLLEEVRS